MTLHVRPLIWILVVLLVCCGTAQAQQVTITSVTPTPICAGANITVSYNNTFTYFPPVETANLDLYLYDSGGSSLHLAQVPAYTGNGSITGLIPASLSTGTYTVGITRTSNFSATYNSQKSSGFTINSIPLAPTVSNISYCIGSTMAVPLTATTSSGGTPTWYTAPSGGPGFSSITPSTSTAGPTTYYVSQTVNGCEGPRVAQTVTINNLPGKPTVVTPPSYCQNDPATALSASAPGTLSWYTVPVGGMASSIAPTPSTSTAGPTTYYVSQTDGNSCESARADITVTVKAHPVAPTVSSASLAYCQNSTGVPPLSATATTGGTLKWYDSSNNLLGNTAPTPPTNAPGTTNYSVSQTINGCESDKVSISVTINSKPNPPTTTPVGVCQNTSPVSLASSVIAAGTLNWYTVQTGGTASGVAPTPPTSTTGSTLYYVSQTDGNGCESDRSVIMFTVNGYPAAPAVSTSPIAYCQGATTAPLSATPVTNGILNWYTDPTGGTRYNNLTPLNTTSNNYYVSQTLNNCEGPRATISVTINALPPMPAVSSPLTYCQAAVAVAPLSATAITNDILYWYGTDPTGGTASTVAPTPQTSNSGQFNYYVSQRDPIGCESARAAIVVTIYPKPVAPTTAPVSACLNSVPSSLVSAVTAIGTLNWYTASSGGTASSVAPTLSTTAVGSITYYVSQTSGDGCESDRASITFTINPLPAAPSVVSRSVFYCQGVPSVALVANAPGILKWYTVRVGGTSTPTLVPPTSVAATTTYYVSQTDGNGCEGPRDSALVVVSSRPTPPTVAPSPAYCQTAVSSSLSATALTGNTLSWYGTASTGGTASSVATVPSTATAGTTLYYVSQTDLNGCESDRASISVTVNPRPAAPITAPINLCQNTVAPLLTSVVAATGILNWYTAASGGTASSVAPTLSTSAVGPNTYYVSQTDGNGCESDRSSILVTIKPLPSAPLVASGPLLLCQSSVAAPLSATAAATGTLKWYDPAGNIYSSVTPSTSVVAPTVYKVSQIVDGCEGPTTSLTVVVIRKPDQPTVVSSLAYCQTETPVPLSATGLNLKWYTDPTNGSSSTVAPTPLTSNVGTTNYYVSQTDANGCESDRASIAVRIKVKPSPPGTAPISFCSNQVIPLTATVTSNGTLNWYGTNATGGTPSATAPTPTTAIIGAPVTYYVSQTIEGCEGDRAALAVTIKVLPVAPVVGAAPVVYCEGTTASPLSATADTGGILSWYTVQTGGTASGTAPIPQTLANTLPTTYYYVSQTVNGCEGPRATIAVTVNPKPAKPSVVSSIAYCQNTASAVLSATAAGTLNWYTDATIATAIPAPTPSTTTPGPTYYYVSQTDSKGCESDRAMITVTITATPIAPITAPINICQNAVTSLTATASGGGTLNWYTVPTGGMAVSIAPIPPTSSTGTVTYYVSQSINGCEGPRATLVVTVLPLPTAPIVSATAISLCQNSVPTALTATASAGGTLNWYTVSTLGVASSAAPTPPTSSVGPSTYYVSQSVNGCEGPRVSITVTIVPLPTAPVISATAISLCQNSVPTALTATASAGGTLNWYTVPAGGVPSSTAPVPPTSSAGTTPYYVSQSVNGCEGPRISIAVTIIPLPTAPSLSATTISLCQNSVPTALTATTSVGGTLNWYTATGGSSIAPVPPTSTAGTILYSVSQTVNGCEGPRVSLTVIINPLPLAPVVSSNTINLCQNSIPTALTAVASPGGTLNWYNVPTLGVASSTAPTPPTSTAGTILYYVSQSVNGCEGPRISISVIIKPLPGAPTVSTSPLVYCQSSSAVALIATPASGGSLNWYGTTPGGTASPAAPTPVTTAPGVSTYYVSQTVNGCEGPQAPIVVLVQPTPAAPTVGSTPIYCQGGTATALSAVASPGGTLNWYTSQTGGTASQIPPIPPVTTSGSITYYVSQSVSGCEGPRISLTATIKAAPVLPVVAASLVYCQNIVAPALTATPSGGTLNWYNAPVGGSSSAVAPVPATNIAGTTLYYVSQTDATGCESNRATISVKVNPLPTAPTTVPVSVCQNATPPLLASSVSATGPLNWYTSQTGGTASSVAPIPVTTAAGAVTYYVSQNDVNGCESNRSLLLVTITPLPAAPSVAAIAPVCQNAASVIPSVAGQGLKWYADATATVSLGSSVVQSTAQAGTFVYYVSQTVNLCESPRAQVQIIVNALPVAPTVVPVQNGCQDALLTVPLTATGTALQWYDASDNLIAPPTPITKVEATQTYIYKVTQTVLGCISPKAILTYIVNVTPPPTVVSPVGYCQNAPPKSLQATGTTLKWYDPAGVVTTIAPTPQTTLVTAGASYSVSQTSLLGCESRKSEIKVVVNALAAAKIEGTTTVNLGSSAVLSLTLAGTGPYSYTLSDGTIGTAESVTSTEATVRKITVTPTASTTYAVTAVSNACGNGTVAGAAVVSVRVPVITTGALSTTTICTGASLTVPFTTTGEFTLGNAFTVEIASAAVDSASRKYISISNGVVQGPSIVTTIPATIAAGQYYVRVSASNTLFPISGTRSPTLLTVRALPTAAFSADKKLIYKGESTELFFTLSGDAPWTVTYSAGSEVRSIASTTNLYSATVTPASTTTYKLISVANICGLGKVQGVDTATVRVDVLLAEADPFGNTVKVYPVPTDETVTIDIDLPLQKEPAQLLLVSFDGHISRQLTTRQRQTILYLDKEAAGIYLLYITVGNQSTVRKVLKR